VASVFKRVGSKAWYVKWKDGHGRWKTAATKARTKLQARLIAQELEQRGQRERLGLDPLPPSDGGGTLRELLEWDLRTHWESRSTYRRTLSLVRVHLLSSPLASRPLTEVTPAKIAELLEGRRGSLQPQSINGVRRHLLSVFARAKSAGRWWKDNPVTRVRPAQVPQRVLGDFLRPHEVIAVLRAMQPRLRPFFATAVYSALRKGELLALRKNDVDLERRQILVRRSWSRETTKGGHQDAIPIARELVPYLEAAMRASATELVFPRPDGRMYGEQSADFATVLRRAMARAGLVTHWTHVCRRKGCGYRTDAPDPGLRRCPDDGRKLWPKPNVRPIRWHDLRHTTATLLLQSGVPIAVVQKILRHRNPALTVNTYGHLTPGYLQAEIDRLQLHGAPPQPGASGPAVVPLRAVQGAAAPSSAEAGSGQGPPATSAMAARARGQDGAGGTPRSASYGRAAAAQTPAGGSALSEAPPEAARGADLVQSGAARARRPRKRARPRGNSAVENPAPAPRKSAGARFTVIRFCGSSYPAFLSAEMTRTLLSLTAPSGSPTTLK